MVEEKENPSENNCNSQSEEKTVMGINSLEKSASEMEKIETLGRQEVSLSYFCENSNLGFQEKGNHGKDLLYPVEEVNNPVENEAENRKKKAKIGTCLSLALPDVSLSLVGLNRVQDGDLPANQWPSRSIQENYGYSVGSHKRGSDQIRNCGEGTSLGIHTRRGSGYLKLLDNRDGGRTHEVSRQRKLLRRIVSEPIPLMAQIVQQLGDETVESIKGYLRNLIALPERKYEFISLQSRLDERSDLTSQTLVKCHKIQLEFFVAIRTGLGSFLSENTRLLTSELVEVFLLERCRNINCRRLLPVKDCGCKICSLRKGFCNECMCLVCRNFDCAHNTCCWVGCDACLHWSHAVCGIRGNLIKPGPSLKGPSRTTKMQFYCLGCGHASEMFGFVKDVFMSCAKEWGEETLMKELDCVRKIFQGSEDLKGKELHIKADVLCTKLVTKMISPSDACNFIFQFFSGSNGLSDFSNVASLGKHAGADLPASAPLIPVSSSYDMSSSSGQKDMRPVDPCPNDVIASFTAVKTIEDESSAKQSKKDDVDSLESVVRIKEAEAQMFQSRADDARGEAMSLRQSASRETKKLNEAYCEKISKLCLQKTEERWREKLEELKALENARYDFCEMKIRLETEIASLLNRMEAAKRAKGSNGLSDFSSSCFPATDFTNLASSLRKHAVIDLPTSTSLIPKSFIYDVSSSSRRKDMRPVDHCPNDVNASFTLTKTIEDEWPVKPSKKDEVNSLEDKCSGLAPLVLAPNN